MPIYEYACTVCGERTEARQGFSDPPLEKCPICGGKLRKLYSPVGIVFKGSGFYSTDSKKASGTSDRKTKEPSKKTEKTDTKKTDPPKGKSKGNSEKSA